MEQMGVISMKQSVKAKQEAEKLSMEDLNAFNLDDALAIDPAIAKEIKDKGHVYRWINSATFNKNYGFDPRRWVPFKSEVTGNSGTFGFKDSEGYIRRGDLILASRSKQVNDLHKAKIERKNKTLAAAQSKEAANELRNRMKDAGIKGVEIHEGYDEND